MNVLKQHIKEIHQIKESGKGYIIVDITTTCHGKTERTKTSFPNWSEWEKARKQGYYLG